MEGHIDTKKTYVLVWAALICLTAITAAVSYVDLGPFSVVVAITIAVIKMLLVALFFMHMRYGSALTKVVVAGGLLWLGVLMLLSMADFVTRGWLPVPGR
jgi:cytochrome c oxidase subunit 4